MNWLLCIWRSTEMIWTCREGARACCSTTDRLNERGMRNSTLLIPLVIIGLLLRVLSTSASHFLENINYVATTGLALSLRLKWEIRRAPFCVLIWLVLGDQHAHYGTSLYNPVFTAKSNPRYDQYYSRDSLEWQQIIVITCNFRWQKGKLG